MFHSSNSNMRLELGRARPSQDLRGRKGIRSTQSTKYVQVKIAKVTPIDVLKVVLSKSFSPKFKWILIGIFQVGILIIPIIDRDDASIKRMNRPL